MLSEDVGRGDVAVGGGKERREIGWQKLTVVLKLARDVESALTTVSPISLLVPKPPTG